MTVELTEQALERRYENGRTDPSKGGTGVVVKCHPNWTCDVMWCVFRTTCASQLQTCERLNEVARKSRVYPFVYAGTAIHGDLRCAQTWLPLTNSLERDVNRHKTKRIRAGYACGTAAVRNHPDARTSLLVASIALTHAHKFGLPLHLLITPPPFLAIHMLCERC
jgi:hypothetical protein